MSEEWTTTRLKSKELEDLHQLKTAIQASIGKTVTLGEAITYALNHVKTGWFESVDLSRLAQKIEIDLNKIYLKHYPPRIGFIFSIDNRNLQELSLRQFVCEAKLVDTNDELGEKTVLKKMNFGAVQKNVLHVTFDLPFPIIEVINLHNQSGDIRFAVEGSAYFGIGDAPPAIKKERFTCQGDLSSSSWKRSMKRWMEKYPLTFKCFETPAEE